MQLISPLLAVQPRTDCLGVETNVIWGNIYRVACMPTWVLGKPGVPDLEPICLKDAYIRLKRTAKARKMRKNLQGELEIRRKFAAKEAEIAAQRLKARPGPLNSAVSSRKMQALPNLPSLWAVAWENQEGLSPWNCRRGGGRRGSRGWT